MHVGRVATGRTVSREELFQQVWEMPMNWLAENFGITGDGLAKICDRLSIPYPPRGYWAKKAAGKKVVQYRLPHAKADTPPSVTISPTPPAPQPEPLAPEQQERVASLEQDGAITVPERLLRPHQVIASWLAEHEQRRREAKRDRNSWGPSFTEWIEIDHRRHRILDALFKAAERHGGTVKQVTAARRISPTAGSGSTTSYARSRSKCAGPKRRTNYAGRVPAAEPGRRCYSQRGSWCSRSKPT